MAMRRGGGRSELVVGDPALFRPLRPAAAMALDEQIVERVAALHAAGRLRKGAHLPRIRALADRLGVSHGTVSRAYKILATRGLVAAASTRGTELLVGTTGGRSLALPWAPPVMQPAPPGDPLSVAIRRSDRDDRVNFDVSECGPDLRPTPLINGALTEVAPLAMAYPPLTALPECAEAVERYLRRRGVRLQRATMLVTSGTTSSLAIVARALARPGSVVLTEHPTWHVALSVFSAAGLQVVGVPVDDDGLDAEGLGDVILRHSPAFLYLQPAFQNPTGVTLAPERRSALIEIARRLHVPIVEDDFASELAFGPAPAPLHAADGEDVVIYLKSFAKLLAPGLRVGIIVAPTRYEPILRATKHGLDPFVSALAQRVVAACLTSDEFDRHLKRLAQELAARAGTLGR